MNEGTLFRRPRVSQGRTVGSEFRTLGPESQTRKDSRIGISYGVERIAADVDENKFRRMG